MIKGIPIPKVTKLINIRAPSDIFFKKKGKKGCFLPKKRKKRIKFLQKKRKKRILHRKFANFLSISGLIFPFKLSKLNENCEAVERGRGRSHPQQKKSKQPAEGEHF